MICFKVRMRKISDKSDKFLVNYSNLFRGALFRAQCIYGFRVLPVLYQLRQSEVAEDSSCESSQNPTVRTASLSNEMQETAKSTIMTKIAVMTYRCRSCRLTPAQNHYHSSNYMNPPCYCTAVGIHRCLPHIHPHLSNHHTSATGVKFDVNRISV